MNYELIVHYKDGRKQTIGAYNVNWTKQQLLDFYQCYLIGAKSYRVINIKYTNYGKDLCLSPLLY